MGLEALLAMYRFRNQAADVSTSFVPKAVSDVGGHDFEVRSPWRWKMYAPSIVSAVVMVVYRATTVSRYFMMKCLRQLWF